MALSHHLYSFEDKSDVRLQEIDSDACVHYCILFGVARSGGETFQNIVKELSTLTRDTLVKFIVKTILLSCS